VNEGPYDALARLAHALTAAAADVAQAAAAREPLAKSDTKEDLRAASERAGAAATALQQLLDWVDSSDLPPGLRTVVSTAGLSQIGLGEGGSPVALGSPGEIDDPLRALAYSSFMGGEYFEHVNVDVTSLGAPGPRSRDLPDRYLDGPEATVRLRGSTVLEDGDAEGPGEPATLYFDPRGARRAAALLRLRAAESEAASR
jgi:hypothetical protein